MIFEWDEQKRLGNIVKHGIDFVAACTAFDGRPVYEYRSRFVNEARNVTVTEIAGRFVAVVWTWRDVGTIRIISVRRARHGEERHYRALLG